MTLPNLLIIGAPKCGTTALYDSLSTHPEIYMSREKEPKFFLSPSEQKRNQSLGFNCITDLQEYTDLFAGAGDRKVVGEGSTSYLGSKQAPFKIKELLHEVKLVAILRDPISRAYSHYNYFVQCGIERDRDFLAVMRKLIANGTDEQSHQYYVRASLYYQSLERYYSCFDRDQIKLYLYEEFFADFKRRWTDLAAFLDIGPTSPPAIKESNVTTVPDSPQMSGFLKRIRRSPHLTSVRTLARKLNINGWLSARNESRRPPALSQECREELLPAFLDDIEKVQDLTGLDLSGWTRRQTQPID
jgi:hypothetical protein